MMKALLSLLFALALCLSSALANISFNHVRLTCNNSVEHSPGYTGCLRGQGCINETCVFYPHSTTPFWHGEQAHGKRNPIAAQAGGEPTIGGDATSGGEPTVAGTPAAGPVTADGSCGAASGNTVCGDWPLGSCCSMYGYCGNDTAHCGSGCQSGPCLAGNPILGPGPSPAPPNPIPGSFAIVGRSGVPAQHAGLLPNNRVVFLDRLEINTELKLANGQFAYSAEYDPETNTVVPLAYQSNAFCSGGTFLSNGDLVSIGGNDGIPSLDPTIASGLRAVRYLTRSSTSATFDGQPWRENNTGLSTARWYASAQILADGNIFVVSGSLNGLDPTVFANNNPTFEILDPSGVSVTPSYPLQILVDNQPYYMYPYIHLLVDGTLFIFTARASQVFSVLTNTIITTLPELPGDFRTYPNGGGSVLLPLSSANGWAPEVMICGGGVVQAVNSPTDPSCGRISPLSPAPTWSMDSMPTGRAMVEGILLPDGRVLWLNGARFGAEGFGLASDPQLTVLIYDPAAPMGTRWTTGASSTIARLYHSVAMLMLDGTVLVAGSNPVSPIVTTPVAGQTPSEDFVTEFRVERYTPPYLSGGNAEKRPTDIVLSSTFLAVGTQFTLTFTTLPTSLTLRIALYHGGFITHGLHMNQRMLFLEHSGFVPGKTLHQIIVSMPPTTKIAPPGPYVVYVVVDGVPGIGKFVMVS